MRSLLTNQNPWASDGRSIEFHRQSGGRHRTTLRRGPVQAWLAGSTL